MNYTDLVYIDETGYHYADYPTFLSWLQDEYRAIYGADVYLEADSQDGQWIAVIARALFDQAAIGAASYNARSPSTAIGAGLASVVKINGIKKRIATKSTVDLDIGGTVGTTITNGIAEDSIGQKWVLPASVTIPISGTITVTAEAQEEGAVQAQAATITKIFTPTLGWQTVNNILAATEGVAVETDAELRGRQTTSVALPSLTVFEGTIGACENIDGVTRVKGYENDSNTTDADGIPANSIAMVVEGGDSQLIANAIAAKKTPGTGTYGSTTVTTYDRYGTPNDIKFSRPTIKNVAVEVSITAFQGYTTGYDTLIKQAVADLINSLKIGEDVYLSKLYVPANLPGTVQGTTFNIVTLKIKFTGGVFGTSNLVIAFNEAAACNVSDISVVVVP